MTTYNARVFDGSVGWAYGVVDADQLPNYRNHLPITVNITESMIATGIVHNFPSDCVHITDKLPRACNCGSGYDAVMCPMNDQFCG